MSEDINGFTNKARKTTTRLFYKAAAARDAATRTSFVIAHKITQNSKDTLEGGVSERVNGGVCSAAMNREKRSGTANIFSFSFGPPEKNNCPPLF